MQSSPQPSSPRIISSLVRLQSHCMRFTSLLVLRSVRYRFSSMTSNSLKRSASSATFSRSVSAAAGAAAAVADDVVDEDDDDETLVDGRCGESVLDGDGLWLHSASGPAPLRVTCVPCARTRSGSVIDSSSLFRVSISGYIKGVAIISVPF